MNRVSGLVSVVVPCWNRRLYILECLNHLAQQTYKNIEIIVVDDASTDGTADLVRRWKMRQTNHIRKNTFLSRMTRNLGYPGALTAAMFMARGEFIAFNDSDDYAHPDRIRHQVLYLRKHPQVGIVGTNYRVVKNGRVLWKMQPSWITFGRQKVMSRYKKGSHCITFGSSLMRGRIFDRIGGLNRRMPGAEDYEFMMRLVKDGVVVDNLPLVLHFVRSHPQQYSRKFRRK